jgi:hypothetical protein
MNTFFLRIRQFHFAENRFSNHLKHVLCEIALAINEAQLFFCSLSQNVIELNILIQRNKLINK